MSKIPVRKRQPRSEASVDEAIDKSFPASDPPSYSRTARSGAPSRGEKLDGVDQETAGDSGQKQQPGPTARTPRNDLNRPAGTPHGSPAPARGGGGRPRFRPGPQIPPRCGPLRRRHADGTPSDCKEEDPDSPSWSTSIDAAYYDAYAALGSECPARSGRGQ